MSDVRHAVAEAEAQGHAAQALLENPVLVASFERLERSYFDAFSSSHPADKEAREAAYFRLQALRDLRADIEGVASNGRLLAHNNRSALRRAA
jgi:hypothetical protein